MFEVGGVVREVVRDRARFSPRIDDVAELPGEIIGAPLRRQVGAPDRRAAPEGSREGRAVEDRARPYADRSGAVSANSGQSETIRTVSRPRKRAPAKVVPSRATVESPGRITSCDVRK